MIYRTFTTTLIVILLIGGPAVRVKAASGGAIPHASIRSAATRGVKQLQNTQAQWFKTQSCTSCHHSATPTLALVAAREHGIQIDESAARQHFTRAFASLADLDLSVQASGIDPADSSSLLVAASAAGLPRNTATAASVRMLATLQTPEGRWRTQDIRLPSAGSDFTSAAYSLRSLQLYMPDQLAQLTAERVSRAKEWLERNQPVSTEDRTFQLIGLGWAGAKRDVRVKAATALLAEQRPDGGWSQIPSRDSDAYATGQALVALVQAGEIAADLPAFRRGLQFLISTQGPDGTWLVQSRQHDGAPVNPPYFESGFPHGHNQFISTAATSWAVMALSLALPQATVTPMDLKALVPAEPPSWVQTALFGSAPALRALLDSGLDPNTKTAKGTDVLMTAATDPDKVKLLIARGADVNARANSGFTPLMVACSYGNTLDVARQLIASGALVNLKGKIKTPTNDSPLFYAVSSGESAKVQLLLSHGADPNQKTIIFSIFPATPLMLATFFGSQTIIRDLVKSGADLRVTDADGMNLIGMAALSGDGETVKTLAELGVDVNHVDKHSMTPLLWAATLEYPNVSLVRNLIAAGADPAIKGKNGVTAVSQARKYANHEVLAVLQPPR